MLNGKIPYAGKELTALVKAHSLSSAATDGDGIPSDGGIPAFLDRTVGLTKAEIDAKRDDAIKKAGKPKKAKAVGGSSKKPKTDNLTETDKANIKALKKAGADKVSTVKKHGAKLKSEKKPNAAKPKTAAKPKAEKKPGIGAAANAAILAGKSNEDALGAVRKLFPGRSNLACISWYRGKLREAGLLKEQKPPKS